MTERLFKVLDDDGTCFHGGHGQWSLPHDGEPGDWMPEINGELEPCKNGYHLCRESDLVRWLGPAIYEAEYRGDRVDADDKIVVREARLIRRLDTWNDRTARLFACDCAESVLHIYERSYPDDRRPRNAIEVARRYANREATDDELFAAWDAAGDAAWAAGDAAWDAAGDAAWAGGDAAGDAAWAAGDAARAAAWDAARAAAWAAVWAAVWDAARAAAWAAAWDAARAALTNTLFHYLCPQEATDESH